MLLAILMTNTSAANATFTFSNEAFTRTWNTADKPVQDLPDIGRGYTWGPAVQGSDQITTESYNGGVRKVQYFDKARMELNNPAANPGDLFYISTGLLVKELVTGFRQDGDNNFTQLLPSNIQIAGDPNDNGANPISPTYASFAKVVTFIGNENGQAAAIGATINSTLDKSGYVSTANPVEMRSISGFDSVTRHNIADVFLNYGNISGLIWDGSTFSQGPVFYGNPTYVLGHPVTEPYWIRAVVAGIERDVLVQLFERRVLTYTPSNPNGFKVEMGNVGQHYYKWRYSLEVTSVPPTQTPPQATPTPPVQNDLQASPEQDYAGQPFKISGSGYSAGETVNLWVTAPDTSVTNLVSVIADPGGNISFTYQSHGPLAGDWNITAHGLSSQVEKVVAITLIDYVPGGPAAVTLSRYHGTINDSFDIHGTNFAFYERYSWWLTAPDGKVYPGEQTPSHRNASRHGNINLRFVPPAVKPGVWTITLYGMFSKRTAYVSFTYDGN